MNYTAVPERSKWASNLCGLEVGHRRPDPAGGRGAPVKADACWGVVTQAHPHSKGGPGRQPNGRGNGLHRRGDKRQGGGSWEWPAQTWCSPQDPEGRALLQRTFRITGPREVRCEETGHGAQARRRRTERESKASLLAHHFAPKLSRVRSEGPPPSLCFML